MTEHRLTKEALAVLTVVASYGSWFTLDEERSYSVRQRSADEFFAVVLGPVTKVTDGPHRTFEHAETRLCDDFAAFFGIQRDLRTDRKLQK
jgi:hypothetical protein